MKFGLFFISLFAGFCKGQPLPADSLVNQKSLRETVFFLSQDSLKGRLTGSAGANIAASFIADKFKSIGLAPVPGNNGYLDTFIIGYGRIKIPAKNVMGAIAGRYTNDTVVIFSAHYDHIGEGNDLPDNKNYSYADDIFNGANDNATGVAALLELAKYYKEKNNNRYAILFIAFSGEEMGMLGSAYTAKKMNTGKVKAVINLEMLGRPQNENCFIVSLTNKTTRNILNNYLKKFHESAGDYFFVTDPYPDENLSYRSDHYPFARKVKIAFTIMGSSPGDEYYHTVDDEYETINFDFLLKATKIIAQACEQFTR